MAYYTGPPIFHSYSHFCMFPDKVVILTTKPSPPGPQAHDYFRDALYHSPIASIASQLMDRQPVRLATRGITYELTKT